jgi:hypothetical protein
MTFTNIARTLALSIGLAALSQPLGAATIDAASCEKSAVENAIGQASAGDTVNVPACPAGVTWSAQLRITKAIHLKGAGVGQTVILDAMPTNQPVMVWVCVPAELHTLSGFEFRNGGRASFAFSGIVIFGCPSAPTQSTIKVYENKFDHVLGVSIWTDNALGVVFNNIFLLSGTGNAQQPIATHQPDWKGSGDGRGDNSWSDDVIWGSSDFLFIENNTMIYDPGTGRACHDGTDGTRFVFRFNTTVRCHVVVHGTDSGGRRRGARAFEMYMNTVDNNQNSAMAVIRSGSALIWGNTGANLLSGGNAAQLTPYRPFADFGPWQPASGRGKWDNNDPGNPFDPGSACPGRKCTITGVGTLTVTVSGAGWATNQWDNYIIYKTTASGGDACPTRSEGRNCHSVIIGNTSDTITFIEAGGQGANMSFAVGDTFEINRLLETLDQPGRGGGPRITGGTASIEPPLPGAWIAGGDNQVDFPVYEWLNTNNGIDINLATLRYGRPVVRENEHMFNHKPSLAFNGTIAPSRSSIGVGKMADRPATCTPGVLYWVTDEGEWWAANPGPDGRAYKCTSVNTWTLFYTPYTYPHPLAGSGGMEYVDLRFSVLDRAY